MTRIGQATLALLATVAFTLPAVAQQGPSGPVRNWGSIFVVAYPGVGTVTSPVAGSTTENEAWNFGSGIGIGASVQRLLGQSLLIGVDGSLAPSLGVEVVRPSAPGAATADTTRGGHARVGEIMASGRILTGGGGGLGLYLAGGAGLLFWGMPGPVSRVDPDLAFRTAAGLEYQWSDRHGLFLEWGQLWAFHQHSGVKSNTIKVSQIRGGVRIGW